MRKRKKVPRRTISSAQELRCSEANLLLQHVQQLYIQPPFEIDCYRFTVWASEQLTVLIYFTVQSFKAVAFSRYISVIVSMFFWKKIGQSMFVLFRPHLEEEKTVGFSKIRTQIVRVKAITLTIIPPPHPFCFNVGCCLYGLFHQPVVYPENGSFVTTKNWLLKIAERKLNEEKENEKMYETKRGKNRIHFGL